MSIPNWVIILAVLALFIGWRMFSGNRNQEEVKSMLDNGALVVDVRTPGEFQSGHYPGAINIPVDEMNGRIAEFGDKGASIVVYCRSGARSGHAAQVLKGNGYEKVVNGGGLTDMARFQKLE